MTIDVTIHNPDALPGYAFNLRSAIDDIGGVLTTEHARSNYGQPVLVWHGQCFGPGDTPGIRLTIPLPVTDAELEQARAAGWDVRRAEQFQP